MATLMRFTEDFALAPPVYNADQLKRATEALITEGNVGQQGLEVTFAAIHEGLTRNDTFYTREGLTGKVKNDQGQESGLASWTQPYNVPILQNHDVSVDPLGRVIKAEWAEKSGKEKGHVKITALVTQPAAIEKFLRGEYQTGSIGMDVDKAECSICGTDRKENHCYHERGKWYAKAPKGAENEGEWIEAIEHGPGARRAHVQMGNLWAREYSVVNVPSDARSKVTSMQVMECEFSESGGQRFSLLEAPMAVESENKPADPVENEKPAITEKSVSELCNQYRDVIEADVLSLYTAICSELAYNTGHLTLTEETNPRAFLPVELEKFAAYIAENNPDLETELNEIKEAVLSSTSAADLPDSAFALVKTVEDKTVRVLPYKDAAGKVNPTAMITALARCHQIGAGFSASEQAKGLKKLRAAALKRGFAPAEGEELQAEITAAKEFLTANGIEVESKGVPGREELETAQARIAALEGEVQDLTVLVEERELENTELVEKVSALNTQAAESAKTVVIEKILAYEDTPPAEEAARRTALAAESVEALESTLADFVAEHGQIVTRRIGREGLGLQFDNSEALQTKEVSFDTQDIIMANLGHKGAKRRIEAAIRPLISK